MASEGGSLSNLVHVYKFVVEDVIKNVKEDFLNEGVEPEVLEQLQELWLRKEDLTDAVNRPRKPQFDPIPTPPQPPQPHPEPSPRLPPALIHQPLTPSPSTVPLRSTGTQSQNPQESVIQLAPARILQATPTLPHTAQSASQTSQFSQISQISQSPSSLPSQQQLELLQQAAGFQMAQQVARGRAGNTQAPPTSTSQAAAAVQVGASPNLMPQLVVNPAALQNQQVLVPVQTSQGPIMVPLASVLAMQQVAMASQQNQSNRSGSDSKTAESTTATVHQIDGPPPTISHPPSSSSPSTLSSSSPPPPSPSPREVPDSERSDSRESNGSIRTSETSLTSFPTDIAAACKKKQRAIPVGIPPGVLGKLLRQQRRRKKRGKGGGVPVEVIVQLDGPGGGGGAGAGGGGGGGGKGMGGRGAAEEGSSSDDDSEGYGDSSEEEEVDQVDEDPLGSDDDEIDSENEDKDFETEDTIACQWEKVYRVKARWKFQLKDGIMRMGGFEYVFHKANGEAEW